MNTPKKMQPNAYYQNFRKEIFDLVPEKYMRVLEIGCGEGNFYANMNPQCEYWGIEPFSIAAKVASQRLHKVIEGTYESISHQLPDNYFDLVICNDVIEHMVDPLFFLEDIKKKTTANASIIGSILNVRYIVNLFEVLVKKDWQYKDDGILDKTHLRFFTEKSIFNLFKKNNYEIETLEGINTAISSSFTPKNILVNITLWIVIACTLGYYNDIQFKQFRFRITKK